MSSLQVQAKLAMVFVIAFLLMAMSQLTIAFGSPVTKSRTAFAVIHEQDGPSGSIVFRQDGPRHPVVIYASFSNIKISKRQSPIEWGLWTEPVHYANPKSVRCSSSLKGTLFIGEKEIGSLGGKHGHIRQAEFSAIAYDRDLTLFGDSPRNIIQRSFVIQQGDSPEDHVCATVYRTDYPGLQAGAVPCELAHYSDCLVAVGHDQCRREACSGYRQFWGISDRFTSAIDENTKFCVQKYDVYPMPIEGKVSSDGSIACKLGRHTNLEPTDS